MQEGGKDGALPFCFQLVVIAYRILCGNAAALLDNACVKEHTFGKGGFARAGMPQQGDIFYMVGIVNCHNGELKS